MVPLTCPFLSASGAAFEFAFSPMMLDDGSMQKSWFARSGWQGEFSDALNLLRPWNLFTRSGCFGIYFTS